MNDVKSFEDLLNNKYGKPGSQKRIEFHQKASAFIIGEMIKDARRKSHLTQEQLANRTGTKKSYISRVESGKSDIQLSTLYKIIEKGLGKTITISIS